MTVTHGAVIDKQDDCFSLIWYVGPPHSTPCIVRPAQYAGQAGQAGKAGQAGGIKVTFFLSSAERMREGEKQRKSFFHLCTTEKEEEETESCFKTTPGRGKGG